jgi:hypothetical protein
MMGCDDPDSEEEEEEDPDYDAAAEEGYVVAHYRV